MKTKYSRIPIGNLVEQVKKWNPQTDKDNQVITYLDISSVSRESKRVEESIEIESHEAPSRARQLVAKDDVLVSTVRPNLNAVAYLEEEFDGATASTGFCVLRAKSNKLDSRYLYYWVRTTYFIDDMVRESTGASYPAVSDSIIKKNAIPLPPLEEQKRIAAILDRADRLRRKRQDAIRLTEELGRSIFLDMFGDPVTNPKGWKIAKIETIAAKEKNSMAIGPFGSNLKVSDYHESGYPIVFVKDVKENNFNWLSNRYVNDKKFKELSSHQVKPLDVLATKMGTPPCISAVYPKSMPTGVITADLIKIAISPSEAIPSYVSIAINSDFCKQQVQKITEGITRPKVTLRDFKKILIPIPPLVKQKEWEYKHEQLNLIKQKNRDQLLQLDELFNSLLQRAFRGEL